LVHRLVEQGLEVTYLALVQEGAAPVAAAVLPPEIEYYAVDARQGDAGGLPMARALDGLVPWADAVYVSVATEHLYIIVSALRRKLLRLRKGFAQALVVPDSLACGVGACDLCTITTRDGYRRACRDGLVFDLLSLT
jgi:hypothetical protein